MKPAIRLSSLWSCLALLGFVVMALNVILETTAAAAPGQNDATPQVIPLHFQSRIADINDEDLAAQALATLNDPRGWSQAGFSYTNDPGSDYQVILAEPSEVDALCAPLGTGGRVSCQNSNVVALNANRWRSATPDWDRGLEEYRHYLFNHEVGHLSGQFHPSNRCPTKGEPEAVMAQQTKGLEGCTGNPWPLDWEIELAKVRPLQLAPGPDAEPDKRAVNPGGGVPSALLAEEPTRAPTSGAEPTPPPTSAPQEAPATTAGAAAAAATTTSVGSSAPDPDEQAGATPPRDDLRVLGDSGGTNWLLIIAAVAGALCLATVLYTLISRKRRNARIELDNSGPGGNGGSGQIRAEVPDPAQTQTPVSSARTIHNRWRVQAAEGSLRRDGLAWHVPERWPSEDAEALGDAADLLGASPTPEGLVETVSAFLRARTHLVPRQGESIALTALGEASILGVVLGEACLVERRSGDPLPPRQRGVVRLRSDETDPLQVDFLVLEGGRQRSVIRVSQRTPARLHPAT